MFSFGERHDASLQGISSLLSERIALRQAATKLQVSLGDLSRERESAFRLRLDNSRLVEENKSLNLRLTRVRNRAVRREEELRFLRLSSSSINDSSARGVLSHEAALQAARKGKASTRARHGKGSRWGAVAARTEEDVGDGAGPSGFGGEQGEGGGAN